MIFAIIGILNLIVGPFLLFRSRESKDSGDVGLGVGCVCFGLYLFDRYTFQLIGYDGTVAQYDVLPAIGSVVFVAFLVYWVRNNAHV